jgi:hypothetical protein
MRDSLVAIHWIVRKKLFFYEVVLPGQGDRLRP